MYLLFEKAELLTFVHKFEFGQPKNLKIFFALIEPHPVDQMIESVLRRPLRSDCGLNVELLRKAFAIIKINAGAYDVFGFKKANRIEIDRIDVALPLSFDEEEKER